MSRLLAKEINAATSTLRGIQLRLTSLTRPVLDNKIAFGVLIVDKVKSVQLLIHHAIAE